MIVRHSMARWLGAVGVAGAALVMSGCFGPERVGFRVERVGADGGIEPATGVLVRAVALDAGELPLPLSRRAFEELAAVGEPRVGVTDDRGFVGLDVVRGRPLMVELVEGRFGDVGAWAWSRWRVGPDGDVRRITEGSDGDALGAALVVRVDR